MSTAYEQLLAEQWPTGTFGQALPPAPDPEPEPLHRPITPWTPEEQERHVADLLTGISGWHFTEPDPEASTPSTPTLRLVTDEPDTSAA
ncbi:hypothetical protein ACWDA7_38905 [Streptomyces sp. NPDC001156]